MVKKGKAKSAKKSSKGKKGTKYTCNTCGMVVSVDKACSCDPCDITCCGESMNIAGCSC